MLRNFIKTAWRSLLENKGFTLINVFGLALGLCACLLISLYVAGELSYDHYNTKYRRIYRLNTDLKLKDAVTSFAVAPAPVGPALAATYPEVEKYVRITSALNLRFKRGDAVFNEDHAIYSDPGIFDVFTLPLLYGDPKIVLNDPKSMVIDESTAKNISTGPMSPAKRLSSPPIALFTK